MQITVNNEPKNYERKSLTVSDLLEVEAVKDRAYVNVQLNGKVLLREDFSGIELREGDVLNYLHFMGGGELTDEEIERYGRQIILPEVGGVGQEKLKNGSVLVVGAGGLGSPVLLYLAAAGVGRIGVIDSDTADLSNLQRQIIHTTTDIGRPKVESAREKIASINPNVKVEIYPELFTAENALDLARNYDVIVDGLDNFAGKFLANDVAILTRRPLVHAGILRFEGQLTTIQPNESACYRCLFREPPPAGLVPSCREAGIFGAVAGVIGTLQATEVLKILTGVGDLLTDRLLRWDAKRMSFRELRVTRDPTCPICGSAPTITSLEASNYTPPPACQL